MNKFLSPIIAMMILIVVSVAAGKWRDAHAVKTVKVRAAVVCGAAPAK